MVKGEIRPQKALPLPAMNTGSNLPRTSVSVANRGMGRSLAVVGSPNGGEEKVLIQAGQELGRAGGNPYGNLEAPVL